MAQTTFPPSSWGKPISYVDMSISTVIHKKRLPYEATGFIRDSIHTSTQRLVCLKKKKVPVFMSFKLREAC